MWESDPDMCPTDVAEVSVLKIFLSKAAPKGGSDLSTARISTDLGIFLFIKASSRRVGGKHDTAA